MKYIIVYEDSKKSDNYVVCNHYEPENFSLKDFPIGKRLADNWKAPTLIYDPGEGNVFSDWLCNLEHWLIVSDAFIEKTAPYLESSVEYLDLTIKNSATGECRNDYKIINILDILPEDVVDLEHSVYHEVTMPEKNIFYRMMIKYAFKEDRVKGYHIFKINEPGSYYKFISEELVKVIKKNKLTGFSFQPVKTY